MSLIGGKADAALRRSDVAYLSEVDAAQVLEPAPAALWAVYLLLAAIGAALLWASVAQVDIVAAGSGRVIPESRDQVIASLEGGILRELSVREGQQVAAGQALALLDPTRFESQQAEGLARRNALQATLARLQAEAAGKPLQFPKGLSDAAMRAESESFEARQRTLTEAVETGRRSAGLLQRELGMAESMSAKGLMSEVEVMRVRRQLNDVQLQVAERTSRFRQEASGEQVRVRNELSLLEEQMVVRDDALRRTTLTSPVNGVVKTIKANTLGGVVSPGATVMEIVPLGQRVLVEARIKPADIGFVKVGQKVMIKLSAYEYTIYGGLQGTVQSISPDVLGDVPGGDRSVNPEATWYRALVRAERSTLKGADGKALAVLPGMSGNVEIRTGRRSVMAYLLRPMLRSQEAFRER